MSTLGTLSSALKLIFAIFTNRKKIKYWWNQLLIAAKRGDTNIIILGRSNIGKTIVGNILREEIEHIAKKKGNIIQTNLSQQIEDLVLDDNSWSKIVRVLPAHNPQDSSNLIISAFDKKNNLNGIMYLVDYGFTRPREDHNFHSLKKDSNLINIQKLREHNLLLELDDFQLISNQIQLRHLTSTKKEKIWLLIIINKIDLFYDNLNEVSNYYHINGKSEFSEKLKNLQRKVGDNYIVIEYFPMCCMREHFVFDNDNIIKSTQDIVSIEETNYHVKLHNKIANLSNQIK